MAEEDPFLLTDHLLTTSTPTPQSQSPQGLSFSFQFTTPPKPTTDTDQEEEAEQMTHSTIKSQHHLHDNAALVHDILCGSTSEALTTPKINKTISWKDHISDPINTGGAGSGPSLLGFSLSSPDLVVCTGSPDIPNQQEDRMDLSSSENTTNTPTQYHSPVTDFAIPPIITINSGGSNTVSPGDIDFSEDRFFTGGEPIQTSSHLGYPEQAFLLYKTARCGNFSYNFKNLDPGHYAIQLHFSEIVFVNGPPGLRIFDIFIQEHKVVSGMDIYARVGSNNPLVLSELRAFVDGNRTLSVRFQGVIGKPIVCGLSIWKDESGNLLFHNDNTVAQMGEHESQQTKLQKELEETKLVLKEVKRGYELKSKECREAWKSLRELQNELMRKSMHVGSLAYAIEGQVKEKSRWFLSLRDLTNKFKLLKREHKKLFEEALEFKKCFADVSHVTTTIQFAIAEKVALEREYGNLKLKYVEGTKERKELYNKILELKGNIRVFCRCRPLNAAEIADGALMAIDFESMKDGELTVKANGTSKKVFKFDSVFSPQAGQADIFEDTAPFATSVLDGFNVCIFAYGQTGTGKTFTMEGTEDARGVNYRTLEELFRVIKDRQGLYQYEMSVSVLEVYNEQIRDLLVPGSQPMVNSKRLEIRQVADGIHHVPGLVEAHVNNMNEVWEVLQTGTNSRAIGATNANEHSSRSHCILCVMVKGENLITKECTRSKLWLVDLAGSERVAKTDVQGDRLKETQNINRSLSALGDVISALATKSPHIPFRNSKLTHLLQDSLGGDSKTLMFVQISPNENDLSETLCSLNFASRVRGIELGPAKKQFDASELVKYKQMVEKAKQDMKTKDGYIKKMEDTIHCLESKAKTRDVSNKNLQEKIKELESQLLVERKLARQHVDNKIVELQQQKQLQEEQNITLAKLQVATPPFGIHNKFSELTNVPSGKDGANLIRPLAEKNSMRPSMALPPTDNFLKYNFTEKENKPDTVEQPPMQRRTGRLSVCPNASNRIPEIPAQRRNSLIPLPTGGRLGATPLLPLQPHNLDPVKDVENDDETNDSDLRPCNSRGQKTAMKKINSILRRSLQKKVQIRSPMQQYRRGGNSGTEKVRVSVGGKNKITQRAVLLNNNANKGPKELQNQKEKEKKGWNF